MTCFCSQPNVDRCCQKKGEKKSPCCCSWPSRCRLPCGPSRQVSLLDTQQASRYIKTIYLHTRVDIMLDYNGLNVNRRLFCSPSDEEWGSRSCRHRSLFPLSVPRQPGNWSSPWLRGSGAVTARLSIRCRWLHSRAVLTIAGHLSQTDPLLSPSFLLSPPGCLSVFVSAHRKCAFFNRPLKDQSAALLSTVQRNSFINETNSFHIKLRL